MMSLFCFGTRKRKPSKVSMRGMLSCSASSVSLASSLTITVDHLSGRAPERLTLDLLASRGFTEQRPWEFDDALTITVPGFFLLTLILSLAFSSPISRLPLRSFHFE